MKEYTYNYKVCNKLEIEVVINHLYEKGYRDFNGHNKKDAIDFYNSRLPLYSNVIYILSGNLELLYEDNRVGFSDIPYTIADGIIKLMNVQKLLREKKLERILK